VGYQGSRSSNVVIQTINLDPNGCGFGQVVHEIGHIIGLSHGQNRPDRDRFVDVFSGNIDTSTWGNVAKTTLIELMCQVYPQQLQIHLMTIAQ